SIILLIHTIEKADQGWTARPQPRRVTLATQCVLSPGDARQRDARQRSFEPMQDDGPVSAARVA
ncbi:MAG: hypothetical protein WBR31_06075, partial [Candidatus Sulfotelmatobacter sp.]